MTLEHESCERFSLSKSARLTRFLGGTRRVCLRAMVGSRIYHTGERYHSELRFDANSRESSDVLFVDIPRCGLSSGGMTAAKA